MRREKVEDEDTGEISLRYLDLKGQDLSEVKRLTAWSLAGSDLRFATLPKGLSFDLVSRSHEIGKNIKSTLFFLLGGIIVCWIVRISTSDLDMLLSSSSPNLPLLGHGIELNYFYWLSPVMLLIGYFYLQLQVLYYADCIANLPTYFPDGLRVDKKVYPLPLVRLSEFIFPEIDTRKKKEGFELASLRIYTSLILLWFAIPLSFLAYWIHYIQYHDFWASSWHVLLIVACCYIDFYFWSRFSALRYNSREPALAQKSEYSWVESRFRDETRRLERRGKRFPWFAYVTLFIIGTIATYYNYSVIYNQNHFPNSWTTLSLQFENISHKDLTDRDLDGSNLLMTKFIGTNLTKTSFKDVKMMETAFFDNAFIIEEGTNKILRFPDDIYFDRASFTFQPKK